MKNGVLGGGLASLAILARNTCAMAKARPDMEVETLERHLAQFDQNGEIEKLAPPPIVRALKADTRGEAGADQGAGQKGHQVTASPPEAKASFHAGYPWLRDRLPELLASGWTRRTLFCRGRYKWPLGNEWGAAWASSWQDKTKTPCIGDHGQIVFTFTSNGEQKQQSIWPGNGMMTFNAKSGRYVASRHEDGRELIPFEGQF